MFKKREKVYIVELKEREDDKSGNEVDVRERAQRVYLTTNVSM